MHKTDYRTYDGTLNNLENRWLGSSYSQFFRLGYADYADRIAQPAVRGETNPNPRLISNRVCRENYIKFNANGLTDYIWAWGQFLHHEIECTGISNSEHWNIPVLRGDPKFPHGGLIEFVRSGFDQNTGSSPENPREQLNLVSSFIDGSNIYGSNDTHARYLRCHEGNGKLLTSSHKHGMLLPLERSRKQASRFITGDHRANQNAILSSLHTLFVLEHNRLCDELHILYPGIRGQDEQLYQLSRAMVVGMMQRISYEEFLPILLGRDALPDYQGYCAETIPTISNFFTSACFRVAHSMFSSMIPLGNNGHTIALGKLYYNSQILVENGIEPILSGLYQQTMREVDGQLVDDARNYMLTGMGDEKLIDLAALNIQRGRDFGLPDFNSCRKIMGLTPHEDFQSLSSNTWLSNQLEKLYGTIDSVDPWIGSLVEDHIDGANVGEFTHKVLVDQFQRLRDGDRFWHQVDPIFSEKPELLWIVQNTRLADVIRRNTGLQHIPDTLFVRR